MSILEKIFSGKKGSPKFAEVASNKHAPRELISREVNSELYKSYLVSLTSSYFLHQAICASKATGCQVNANLAQNAKESYGILSSQPANPNSMGIYTFVHYCNAVRANANINLYYHCAHNQNIFSHNVLNNASINQQQLKQDLSTISTVHEAVLSTYAGTDRNPYDMASLTPRELQNFSVIYSRSPQTAFGDTYFQYPDGQSSKNAKTSTDKITAQDPNAVPFALNILTSAAVELQQTLFEKSDEFGLFQEQ